MYTVKTIGGETTTYYEEGCYQEEVQPRVEPFSALMLHFHENETGKDAFLSTFDPIS